MATQTRERDRVIEMKLEAVKTIDLSQDVNEGSVVTSSVHGMSEAQIAIKALPDHIDGLPSSHSITKVLVRFARQMAVVYDLLVAAPATERGRIENAMAEANHDRFISFLR